MKKKKNEVNLAVIGVGHLGYHHARLLNAMYDVNLVGIVDTDKDRLKKVSKEFDIKAYSDVDCLLNDCRIDGIIISAPTECHCDLAAKIIKKSINIFIEKPMVSSRSEARKIYNALKKNNVIVQIGHVERFNPTFVNASKLIKKPAFVEIHRLSPFPKRSTDIGVILDIMIHDIDLLLSMVNDKVMDIKAVGAKVITKYEDIANARLEFQNGCIANLTASRLSHKAMRKIRVFQKNKYITMDLMQKTYYAYSKKKKYIERMEDIQIEKFCKNNDGEPLKRELIHFVHCIQKNKKPVVGFKEGRNALDIAFRIIRSIKSKKFY